MKKTKEVTVASLVLVAVALLLLAGGAYAGWGGGYGPCYGTGANAETVQKYRHETVSLRDELVAKRIELRNEYNKPVQDANRIGELRKEIIDLQTKIHTAADKYGLTAGDCGMGRGMMAGTGGGRGMIDGISMPYAGMVELLN
ncbi:MAG: hypothetical protein HQL09_06475 [Nitrospirae bacterium]|nr:hypothetical protein [Nitrospirota bacterium]